MKQKPEPLKGKWKYINYVYDACPFCGRTDKIENNHFASCCEDGKRGFTELSQTFDWVNINDDIKSAVEWLKEKTKNIDTHGLIDEAFEDVTNPDNSDT